MMPGSTEEKEKCLEKLKQMQKFIPFLDFMIEKISKKNNETSLECQLGKLRILRSMIAEKNEKYSWDVIVKVEDVIQRLISKLDVKDRYGYLKDQLEDADSEKHKTSMAASISKVPSSTSAASVTTNTNPQSTASDGKPNAVDLIMRTLKTSVEQTKITDRDKELLPTSLSSKLLGVSGKPMETDLDKDLDGYDLTDCPGLTETSSSNTTLDPAPEKPSSHDDLLSSSREKLLKSLQTRHFPVRTNLPPGDKSEKPTDSSAFSRSQVNLGEQKPKSDFPEDCTSHGSPRPTPGKSSKTGKSMLSPEKTVPPNSDVNLKQRLKEKLSTDICEVYRVPGKSVGGSLRSLKECKDIRKSLHKEEDEMGIVGGSHSRSSSHRKLGSSEKKEHKSETSHKWGTSGKEKRSDNHSSGRSECKNRKAHKSEERRCNRTESRKPPWKRPEDRRLELDKLNDDELLEFVKENMHSLPQLAKLKSSELRKAVRSSLNSTSSALDPDMVSEISDDSFQDFEDVVEVKSKGKPVSKEPPHPLASVKMTQVGPDGVAKNVKPIIAPSKETKILEEIGDKTHDIDDISLDDDDDYAMKLIEETTPKTPQSKKKGLLELPMPVGDDLFEEISSIGSFEPSSPSEIRDPRLAKLASDSRNKSECSTDQSKPAPRPGTKDLSSGTTDKRTTQDRPELCKPITSYCPPDVTQLPRFPTESNDPMIRNPFPSNNPRPHVSLPSEPKSYAEYKRMKKIEQKKLAQQSFKEKISSDVSVPEKDVAKTNLHSEYPKQGNNTKNRFEGRKTIPYPKQRRPSSHADVRKNDEDDDKCKKVEEKRCSSETEELVSPLEELYRNDDKPKTGRGYGIQNFKIPKKMVQRPPKENTKQTPRNSAVKSDASGDPSKRNKDPARTDESEKSEISHEPTKDTVEPINQPETEDVPPVEPPAVEDVPSVESVDSSVDTRTNASIIESVNCDIVCELPKSPESGGVATEDTPGVGKTTDKTEDVEETNPEEPTTDLSKCDTQTVECEPSTESLNEGKDPATPTEKNPTVQKEEITQEFVEALIRKSFQSGEGKLLLAQVKLFEEFAKKLNSKKLKTIQRIINSESGSSSYSSEVSSDEEKKKKKSKKSSEQKNKKRKRKVRKSRKYISSSSSSSESEETSEEESDKKEESCDKKEGKPDGKNSKPEETGESSGVKTKGKKSPGKRGRPKRRNQNKDTSEEPAQQEDTAASPAPETEPKEPEQKKKTGGRVKGRTKTELDRLHDDIRGMFISDGVVTATGQRMCRILRQSGGNMNNLDIVKESAKMVEEEKLKKVQTRPSRSSDSNRSQSSEKGAKAPDKDDPKLKMEPRVCLQRVDLDNFGYAVKVSEDCISFRRMKGRNTAIRGAGVMPVFRKLETGKNVFLARNKRKFERLRDSNRKKVYRGKSLTDIVKNLPLKMAKMKHLQICERTTDADAGKKKKRSCEVLLNEETSQRAVDLTNSELQCYAFEKRRRIYICKLCNHITRNITGHYKLVHTEHEVLISRLCLDEAEAAKLESYKYPFTSAMKRKRKPFVKRPNSFCCRMCSFRQAEDVNSFAEHVSSHTGEYRYLCPENGCGVLLTERENLKFHILAKHPKRRYELYSTTLRAYPLIIENNQLFGFLCSLCHFVQIRRCNLEKHIRIQHSYDDARIIKINMSSKRVKSCRKKTVKQGSKDLSPCSNDEDNQNSDCEVKNTRTETKNKRERSDDEGNSDDSDNELLGRKRILLQARKKDVPMTPDAVKCNEEEVGLDETMNGDSDVDVEGSENVDDVDVEDCVDLKNISNLKGSDIICSVETSETNQKSVVGDEENSVTKLQVGPLAALMSSNSTQTLYECYVKGCLFSTQAFFLFEKHINITHCGTKWNGICEICRPDKASTVSEKNQFKLLTALNHLKLHARGRQSGGKLSPEDLIMELKLVTPSESCGADCDDADSSGNESKEKQKVETSEKSYPAKPLLRVRNLLGDRLSTPKSDEGDVVAVNEEDSTESSTDSSKMFTIENVRSLTESPDSEIKIEQVCSLKDLVSKPLPSGKTILVRSCPTRKIAIRPEPAVDVGTINVVQPPAVAHPVVLSPLSRTSPIRILSTALSPTPSYTVKPLMVPTDGVRLNTPNILPVIGTSPAVTTTTIVPVSESSKQENSADLSKIGLDVEVIPSPGSKSPIASSSLVKNSSDVEDADEKDTIVPQRYASSPNAGKKSVKDAKIYREMLTKTKLCHLFKCMGIECSFTCNSESVFTQHIGLHDAQRRIKRNKGMKMMFLRTANKSTRAFYWQQCAYCCEVLSNTNKALSSHILEEHGHCMYQCAFCFYRAVSHCYVEIHQDLAHSQILKTTPRVIYKCKPLKVPPSQAVALEKHGRRQSVRPYHCDQCGRKFYITREFTDHLQTEHQSVTAYTCHICKNLCFKVNRLLNHYKLHSYSTYQCAYCLHGTETEKEMVFHLCNFHFSQPAVMYVRALAEGQSGDEIQMQMKKKKNLSNQLDSLKVVVYEGENPNLECIVEAEPDEEIPENISESSLDLSSIVAELGIYTDSQSSTSPVTTPLMKELASIGDKSAKHLTVKTLLPNAQFSSENENGTENCSVLISSGLSIPSDTESEREMNIPLGQLPLEAVNVQHKDTPSRPNSAGSPDKNLRLNEIIVNLQHKDTETTERSTAVHKLPPVVAGLKTPYKSVIAKKKTEPENADTEKKPPKEEKTTEDSETGNRCEKKPEVVGQPLITNVVSLSGGDCPPDRFTEESIIISDICSLSTSTPEAKDPVVINIKSTVRMESVLKPPIIRLEDFPMDNTTTTDKKTSEDSAKEPDKPPASPDIIILEDEKRKNIETVTLDSDDEDNRKTETPGKKKEDAGNETIRKEMELLRNQIANETDSLLLDEPETQKDLTLKIAPNQEEPEKTEKTLLSPIEEAICSLNKKLESENQEAEKRKEEEKEKPEEKTERCENKMADRPRTRFGWRKECVENAEKSDADDSSNRKDGGGKFKRFTGELVGKDLYVCGNEKCTFAAETDAGLKDHLYVCDLSRESSVLVCPHCSKPIKQFRPYLDHLKYHGVKKFHCGLCNYRSPVDFSVTSHMKQKHKCSSMKVLPKESMEGHLVYYPKNYKVDKVDFEANGYLPGDEDKLPLQSVYQVNVKCAKCPYFTKVRSNMVRHLKIHVKSVETEGVVVVPSTAPTNPVPCLETKERMFDKMTNLAASSQLAQAKDKTALESLSPEEEAKLPQFVAEQMRYKCCLPDCNYITVDDGMLKHHIKALHDEINYYSCPHCRTTVHVDVRHVTLDKIGFHLKHHDAKLYKCPHCIFFHFQKNAVEKHTAEKHPDRRFFLHVVREPKADAPAEEEPPSTTTTDRGGARVWKCGLCDDFHSPSKPTLMDHLLRTHNTKSKYKCKFCNLKGNSYQTFISHFASKHPAEKFSYEKVYYSALVGASGSVESQSGNSSGADSSNEHFDTTPLWQRGAPRIRHIRGILIEEEEIKTKKSKKASDADGDGSVTVNKNAFYCPLCTNKKKPFYTRFEECFRTHLYQELNYQQFACILCGKMFVDRKDFDRHHSRVHADKPQSLKQTKEDHEIKFWVDQVIAKQRKQMEERKRKLDDSEESGDRTPPKRKKEG